MSLSDTLSVNQIQYITKLELGAEKAANDLRAAGAAVAMWQPIVELETDYPHGITISVKVNGTVVKQNIAASVLAAYMPGMEHLAQELSVDLSEIIHRQLAAQLLPVLVKSANSLAVLNRGSSM